MAIRKELDNLRKSEEEARMSASDAKTKLHEIILKEEGLRFVFFFQE